MRSYCRRGRSWASDPYPPAGRRAPPLTRPTSADLPAAPFRPSTGSPGRLDRLRPARTSPLTRSTDPELAARPRRDDLDGAEDVAGRFTVAPGAGQERPESGQERRERPRRGVRPAGCRSALLGAPDARRRRPRIRPDRADPGVGGCPKGCHRGQTGTGGRGNVRESGGSLDLPGHLQPIWEFGGRGFGVCSQGLRFRQASAAARAGARAQLGAARPPLQRSGVLRSPLPLRQGRGRLPPWGEEPPPTRRSAVLGRSGGSAAASNLAGPVGVLRGLGAFAPGATARRRRARSLPGASGTATVAPRSASLFPTGPNAGSHLAGGVVGRSARTAGLGSGGNGTPCQGAPLSPVPGPNNGHVDPSSGAQARARHAVARPRSQRNVRAGSATLPLSVGEE